MKWQKRLQNIPKLPVLGVLGFVFTLYTLFSRAEVPRKEPYVQPPTSAFQRSIGGLGVIEPKSEVITIAPELSGVVRAVQVRVGDVVEKDAPLLVLDQREIDAHIATLKASLKAAQVAYLDADSQAKIIESIDDVRARAQDDVNRKRYARERAKAQVGELEAEIQEATVTKDRLTVRAPISGTVLQVDVRVGEFAAAGVQALPLIKIGDLSELRVRAEVDEEFADQVASTTQAVASSRGAPNKRYPLTFVRFEPLVRTKQNLAAIGQRVDTRVRQIIYSLPAEAKELAIGQQMDIFIARPGGGTL